VLAKLDLSGRDIRAIEGQVVAESRMRLCCARGAALIWPWWSAADERFFADSVVLATLAPFTQAISV
jgi:hypothetical protein